MPVGLSKWNMMNQAAAMRYRYLVSTLLHIHEFMDARAPPAVLFPPAPAQMPPPAFPPAPDPYP